MKVLIISHNPMSTFQNMGKSLFSLFSSFSKEEICQLYCYPTIPDVDICSSSYRITDKNVFDSYFRFGKMNQQEITTDVIDTTIHELFETEADKELLSKKRSSKMLLLRDTMWRFSKWYSKDLNKWLNQEQPSCIFLAPGDSMFIYNLALRISREFKLPIVVYICDDYYFMAKKRYFFDIIQVSLLKRKIAKTIKQCSTLVVISDQLKYTYSNYFNKPAFTVYTGSTLPENFECVINSEIKQFSYIGNLSIWRYESIYSIGKAIDEYNKDNNTNYRLNIYSRSIPNEAEKLFSDTECISFCGFVSGKEYIDAISKSDVLIHVESFREEAIDRVKYSVSTKIADSLYSGVPLFAYGPENVASMKYLNNEKAAVIVSNPDQLLDAIAYISNYNNRLVISNRELKVSRMNHSINNNSKRLHSIIKSIDG